MRKSDVLVGIHRPLIKNSPCPRAGSKVFELFTVGHCQPSIRLIDVQCSFKG